MKQFSGRIFVALLLFAAGCSSSDNQNNIPTLATASFTVTPTFLPSSATLTSVASSTGTPLPTLSPEDREKLLAEFLRTNGNCSRPCFWGIIPGTSNFDDTVAFLKSLGRRGLEGVKDSTRYYNVTYSFKDETGILNVVLLAKSTYVDGIGASLDGLQSDNVSTSDWSAFRPDKIIETYGTPSSVKIVVGEGPDGRISYQLLLIYDGTELSILYDPTDAVILPAPVLHTCPLAKHGIRKLDFWLGRAPHGLSSGMKEINEVSSLTIEEFSKLIVDKKEKACFDINLKN